MSAKKRPLTALSAAESAAAVKMIIVPSKNQTLRAGSTIRVITPTSGQAPGQAMIVGKPMTIQHTPSGTGQTAVHANKTSTKSPVKSAIKPPSGEGTITILSQMPSSGETTGAVRMICNVEKTRILPHHFPVSLTTTIEPCSDTQNIPLLPRPPPASTSKDPNQIPLSEECPPPEELGNPPPAAPAKVYTYKSGHQYPPDLKRPRVGTTMDFILTKHPSIEVFSLENKEKKNYFSAYCHSCKIEFLRTTAEKLNKHIFSLVHDRRLNLPDNLAETEVKEQARRKLILSNKKFTSFLEVREEETLWCKLCDVQLQYSNDKVTAHRYTIKHMSNAEEETEEPQFTKKEKLEKLHKLVDLFPDFLALVTEVDKRINDEIFEYYKTPDQITLQVNDLYCKPCRRKFVRTNYHSFRDAVIEHKKTKQHQERMEQQQQQKITGSDLRMRAAVAPPQKICSRTHDPLDLKEAARVLVEGNMALSQSGTSLRNVVQAAIGRPASSTAMSTAVKLLNEDFLADMTVLADRPIFIVCDEAHFHGVCVVNITIGALDDNSIPSFAVVATSDRSLTGVLLAEEIMSALRRIWTTDAEVVQHQHQVISLTTDGAAYNGKAARILREKGLKTLHHVLCLAHGVSLVANVIVDNHRNLQTFASNVQSTFAKSVVQQVSFKNCSNVFVEEELRDHLLQLAPANDAEPKVDMSLVPWEAPSEACKSMKMWSRMAEHAELVEKEGGVEVIAEEKGPVWKKAVRTRFGTQLAQLNHCHQYFQQVANYVSKLKVKRVKEEEDKEEEEKKKRKQAKLKKAKAQLANSDWQCRCM